MAEEMSRRTFQEGTGRAMSRSAVIAMVVFAVLVFVPFGFLIVNWFG